jgi:hypothetical protein
MSKIAPHAKLLAKHMPAMLSPLHGRTHRARGPAHGCRRPFPCSRRKLILLLPLLPAAEQAGLLNQKLALAALRTVLHGPALQRHHGLAIKTAVLHNAVLQRAGSAKRALLERYQLYQAKPSAIAEAVAETTPQY